MTRADTRREDWADRLAALLDARAGTPFAWGAADCCLFVADAVAAVTGVDIAAAEFRGRYRDAASGARVLRRWLRAEGAPAGQPPLAALWRRLARRHGWRPAPIEYARRGDIVLLPAAALAQVPGTGYDHAAAIVDLCGARAVTAGPAGLVRVPLAPAGSAWRVG